MAKESLYGIDIGLFRETFNSEQDTRRNGVIPTNITYSDGVGSFNGTTSIIDISNVSNGRGDLYARFKIRFYDVSLTKIFFHMSDGDTSNDYISVSTFSNRILASRNNNSSNSSESSTLQNNVWYEVLISKTSTTSPKIYINGVDNTNVGTTSLIGSVSGASIGARIDNNLHCKCDVDLFEFDTCIPTAEEVKNIYEGERYRGITLQNTTYKEVLNIDSRRGAIYDKYGNTITNTNVEIVRDGEIYAERYNGSTSRQQIGYTFKAGEPFTILCWSKTFVDNVRQAYIGNSNSTTRFFFDIRNNNQFVFQFFDGSVFVGGSLQTYSEGFVNKNRLIGIVFNGISTAYVYIDGVLIITLTKAGFSPVDVSIEFGAIQGLANLNGNQGMKIAFLGMLSPEEMSQFYTSTKQYFLN